MNDANGNPDPKSYNAVHWDGQRWELIKMGGYGGYPRRTVFAFSKNDVWFDGVIKWDGEIYTVHQNGFPLMPNGDGWQINKMWGSSSKDLYAVGNNGNIAHWNGSSWKKKESGTNLNIYDIWGDYNNKTKEWEILAVASHYGISSEKEILQISNNIVKKLSTNTNPPMEPLVTTWFVPNRKYYVAGSGIYQKNSLMDSLWKHNLYSITTYATTSIRGNGINDVIGVGAFGDVVHFNGKNWKSDYQEPLLSNGSYTEVDIKGNLVVAVGGNNSKAVALFGRRY
ncbi:MAG TPA: hypothetical protein PK559_08280 [Ignavibacteriaceae bacterium]|nr:hypothetical protein [Ignavibacteriaceae bacterium]